MQPNVTSGIINLNDVVSAVLSLEGLMDFLKENSVTEGKGLKLGTFYLLGRIDNSVDKEDRIPKDGFKVSYGLTLDTNALKPALFCYQQSWKIYHDEWHPFTELLQGFKEDHLTNGFRSDAAHYGLPDSSSLVYLTIQCVEDPKNHLFDYAKAEKEYRTQMEKMSVWSLVIE
jgi:hypothetical protein